MEQREVATLQSFRLQAFKCPANSRQSSSIHSTDRQGSSTLCAKPTGEWWAIKSNWANMHGRTYKGRVLHPPGAIVAQISGTPSSNSPDSNQFEKQDWWPPNLENGQGKIQKLQQSYNEKIVDCSRRRKKMCDSATAVLVADARDLAAKENFVDDLVGKDVRAATTGGASNAECNVPESTESRNKDQSWGHFRQILRDNLFCKFWQNPPR